MKTKIVIIIAILIIIGMASHSTYKNQKAIDDAYLSAFSPHFLLKSSFSGNKQKRL